MQPLHIRTPLIHSQHLKNAGVAVGARFYKKDFLYCKSNSPRKSEFLSAIRSIGIAI